MKENLHQNSIESVILMNKLNSRIFKKLSNLIYQEIGVNLPDKKRAMVNSRLSKRLRELGLDNYETYYQYLSDNKSELIQLYNILTTNTTHFFREKHHFEFLKEHILSEIKVRRDRKIRCWSAGCSSGQEPYTLAIVLADFFNNSDWDSRILATDINTEVLKIAKQGIYSKRQVKNIPYDTLVKYFKLGTGKNKNLFKLKRRLKQIVNLRRLNLNQSEYPIKSKLDFIFCRNVFIYFEKETRNKILHRFYHHLRKGGYLFLGHSESIRQNEQVNNWKLVAKTTYQKL
ncbi:protein-glutamate O-methyltransferase [Halanaerocella petrolearia]